ncbi:MAG: IS66 family insertion sequence element accessory protein TnpB [Planctomycetota bacterium]|nr:IS66 family insertion sequence element accessory protein TnpB [Planctomycetota bacterium]
MTALPTHQPIFLCTTPTDMRKSFCGLTGIIRQAFGREPTDGSLFLFVNRKRDSIKILYWDRDGLAIWYKPTNLRSVPEAGTFEQPRAAGDQAALQIDATQLAMILGGVSLQSAQRRKRYQQVA